MPTPAELADQYLAGAAALRQAVKGMTREQALARPIAGQVEHAGSRQPHRRFRASLRRPDEAHHRARRRAALARGRREPLCQGVQLPRARLEEQLTLVEAIRKEMARIIRSLKPEQLQLTGCHNKKGIVTLEKS